jgi:tetratricopeptide (TPR) repeat protein
MTRSLTWALLACLTTAALAAENISPLALVEAGHFKRALAIVEPRFQADPNDAEAAYLLSRVKEAFEDLDSALRLAQKSLELDDKNARYHLQLANVYGEMAQRAGIFKQMGLARKYKSEAERAASLDPKFVDARMGLIEFYLEAPGIAGGDKKKARELADDIARSDSSQGYMAQARLAQQEKDTSKQEAAYLKAIAANPRNYDAEVSLASLYAEKLKNYDAGEKHARAAIQLDLGRVHAYAVLATIFAAQKRWPELDTILSQAEKNVPDDVNPYYQAGKKLLLDGVDLGRAERYFHKYMSQPAEGEEPDLAAAHWRLGLVLEKQGRKREAISEIQTAVSMKSDFPEAKKDLKRLR